jgi:hypothetical protein
MLCIQTKVENVSGKYSMTHASHILYACLRKSLHVVHSAAKHKTSLTGGFCIMRTVSDVSYFRFVKLYGQ